jgi:carbon monoxide dehydrogenase subunit G
VSIGLRPNTTPKRTRRRQSAERRVYVKAEPRTVWAVLHDPLNAEAFLPELSAGPSSTAATWPAAAATRAGRARLGLLREPALAESLEARPDTRFRYRLAGDGFVSEWTWALEPLAGGTRVVHTATLELTDRVTGLLVRLGGESLGSRVERHLRALKERAELAETAADATATPLSARSRRPDADDGAAR